MIRMAVVGLGKMGLSHLSMVRAHPSVEVPLVVDSSGYVLDVLSRYTGLATATSYEKALESTQLDAVLIATPTPLHAPMIRSALAKGLHVFCEKPLCLTAKDSAEIAALAESRGLVTQVGYHNRFVGAFREVKRLLDANAIGRVTHVLAEAYGPVVLRAKGSTWRSRRSEGGGCLYDYAAHPLDLLTWYVGSPTSVSGTVLGHVFSQDAEDEVFSTLKYRDGCSAQISVNWSDESCRKMTTRITLWGTGGRIFADRQEVQAYLRDDHPDLREYGQGWTVRHTTELTDPVWFYLRGEEYSAQLDHFIRRVERRETEGLNSFTSAASTDRTLEMISTDGATGGRQGEGAGNADLTTIAAGQQERGRRVPRWKLRRP